MKTVDVAVQIVNYKTKAFLEPLVASILSTQHQSNLKLEINLVDNASGDNLDYLKERWPGQKVNIYQLSTNKGFGAGQNFLASNTKASYLLLTNPDTYFNQPNTIDRLIKTLEATQSAVVGPRLLSPRSRQQRTLSGLQAHDLQQQKWDHGLHYIGAYKQHSAPTNVAWVSGAAFLISRELFLENGGFDETFFMYNEELDLCRRLRRQGHSVTYDPNISIIHYSGAVAKKASVYGLRSLIRLIVKGFTSS